MNDSRKISLPCNDLTNNNRVPEFLSRNEYTQIIKNEEERLKGYGIPFECFKSYEDYVKIYKDNLDKYM